MILQMFGLYSYKRDLVIAVRIVLAIIGMAKNMETSIMSYIGFRVVGLPLQQG